MEIPEKIVIKEGEYTQKKRGRPKTEVYRRNHRAELKKQGKAVGQRYRYSDKEKMEAACYYATTGNSRRTSEMTKIPEGTIRAWKTTEWWAEIQARIIKEQDEELGTKLTALVDKAVEQINDRLTDGDYVYNPKLDKLIRKPVNAKDIAIVTAISLDKRQLLRGQPTSRTETVSQDQRLKRLSEEFKKFAQAKEVVQDDYLEARQNVPLEEKDIVDVEPLLDSNV
jgi:hypothetical protein